MALQSKDALETAGAAALGATGFTFPWWSEIAQAVAGINTFLVSILGIIVLVLTARKLWLENRIAQHRLDEEEADEHDGK